MFQSIIDTLTFDQIIDQFLQPQSKIQDSSQCYDEMPLENYLNEQYGFSVLQCNTKQLDDDDLPLNGDFPQQIPNFLNIQEDQQLTSSINTQENSPYNLEFFLKSSNSLILDAYDKNILSQNDDDLTLNSIPKFANKSVNLKEPQKLQATTNQHEDSNDHLESLDLNVAIKRYSKKYDIKISHINTIPLINQIKKKCFLRLDCQESLELLKVQKRIHLKSVKRKDVVLKTTIREIRRTYLQQFKQDSKFSSVSRYRHQKYYLFAIQKFVTKLFQGSLEFEAKQNDDSASKQNQLFNELVFFLGSVFYPNKMMRLIDDEGGKKIVKLIDTSLHQFTFQRLCFLGQWDAFKHVLQHYIDNFNHKSHLQNKHIASSIENFEKSINFLKGMILQ
ncbi:UNKNOWN [Stylonychia lemnae]|uniref:Uncharacterized protein n=1 Tax=Stylonychia lemnae TaxID=5949 RepID=A0A078AXK4_STYLE|nr:UNKNOWN [Stylonychia lemnae]|eukprot:CDW87195.1 UNKNOWN [Stylonychia lemnae]